MVLISFGHGGLRLIHLGHRVAGGVLFMVPAVQAVLVHVQQAGAVPIIELGLRHTHPRSDLLRPSLQATSTRALILRSQQDLLRHVLRGYGRLGSVVDLRQLGSILPHLVLGALLSK